VAGRRTGYGRAWSARELGLLTAIADQLAPAIYNAGLYAQTRENEASLQAGNQVLHEINEMLIKKNVDLEEFIGRDLEPTLAAVLGVLERLPAQDGSGLNEELTRKARDLQQILSRLRGLTQDFT
jgi:GAF domain-containing protein